MPTRRVQGEGPRKRGDADVAVLSLRYGGKGGRVGEIRKERLIVLKTATKMLDEGERPSEDSPGCLGCMRIEVASVILFDGVTRVCDLCPEYLRQMRGE
jgi:hypothetical protein